MGRGGRKAGLKRRPYRRILAGPLPELRLLPGQSPVSTRPSDGGQGSHALSPGAWDGSPRNRAQTESTTLEILRNRAQTEPLIDHTANGMEQSLTSPRERAPTLKRSRSRTIGFSKTARPVLASWVVLKGSPEPERDILRAEPPARVHTGTPNCGSTATRSAYV